MHTAIECSCGNIIVYDLRIMTIVCPTCERRWMQAPELFGDDGLVAKRLPYLCAEFAQSPVDSIMLGAIATDIRRGIENHNSHADKFGGEKKTCPQTFTAIGLEGQADIPTSLRDFVNTNAIKLSDFAAVPQQQPPSS